MKKCALIGIAIVLALWAVLGVCCMVGGPSKGLKAEAEPAPVRREQPKKKKHNELDTYRTLQRLGVVPKVLPDPFGF